MKFKSWRENLSPKRNVTENKFPGFGFIVCFFRGRFLCNRTETKISIMVGQCCLDHLEPFLIEIFLLKIHA